MTETDCNKKQMNLLARLLTVYDDAIGASDNRALSSRNVETPTDTFHAVWDANSGCTSPYQQRVPSQYYWPQSREGSVAGKEVVMTLFQPHIKSAWPSPDPDLNFGLSTS